MEELTRLQASRKAFKGHVTRLHSKIDDLMDSDFDDYTIISLNTAIEQIKKKGDRVAQVDEKIATLLDDASELESVLYDAEEFQDDIVDKITRATRYIELCSIKPSRRSQTPPRATSYSDLRQLGDHTTTVQEVSPVTAPSVVESGSTITASNPVTLEPVSAIVTSSDSTLSTAAPSVAINITNIPEMCSAQPITPVTTMVYSTSLGPPPLIPADTYSVDSQHRPIASTLFAPYSVYNLPINTQHQVPSNSLINASTVFTPRYLFDSPSLVPQHSSAIPVLPLQSSLATAVLPSQSVVPSHQSQMFSTSRLPKLSLPTFSGELLAWQTFWDSFYVAIHINPNLGGIQKFSYLKAQLVGDAARTIAGLPLTDTNYHHAIAILKDRYGQHHKIMEAHMQALLEIPSPSNSLNSMRTFYDTVETHIRGLSSLGKPEHSYGDLLIPVVMGKLPGEIQRNLAREHSNSAWNLPDLMAGVLKEIRILETGPYDPCKSVLKSTATVFHVASSGNRPRKQGNTDHKKPQCVFCKRDHPSHNCDVVTDYKKRLDIVKEQSLCFNCLARHRVSQCPSKFRCRKCKKKHHTSLCNSVLTTPEEPKTEAKTDKAIPTTTAQFLTPASCCNTPKSTTCLLKTAVAPVIANGFKIQANILFDEGVQRLFISAGMAKELHISPTSNI